MFSLQIVDADVFLEMPATSQLLYFHLAMRADDDGFVSGPKRIMKIIGAQNDDLKVLLSKRFIIGFESGIVVIKHWKIHNYIQKDRYHPSPYNDELKLLTTKENGSYTECIQNVSELDTEVRLGKVSLGKVSGTCTTTKFVKPTPEEVQSYLNSLNEKRFTGQYFCDKNDSTGWLVGRNRVPMKDWKATVRTWVSKQDDNKPKSQYREM
jgi:hypothetical protein